MHDIQNNQMMLQLPNSHFWLLAYSYLLNMVYNFIKF